jgi:hypothetical protein
MLRLRAIFVVIKPKMSVGFERLYLLKNQEKLNFHPVFTAF